MQTWKMTHAGKSQQIVSPQLQNRMQSCAYSSQKWNSNFVDIKKMDTSSKQKQSNKHLDHIGTSISAQYYVQWSMTMDSVEIQQKSCDLYSNLLK
jgi:hypothetical protein